MSTVKKLNIGVIGYKNHALRLINEFYKSKYTQQIIVYHPKKKLDPNKKYLSTNNFQNLKNCHAIIISSPTNTHYKYLKLLENYSGYIFLEKPAVNKAYEEKKLLTFKKKLLSKIYINYNFLFSKTFRLLKKSINHKSFGKCVHFRVESSHGLAFKNEYSNSWRSKLSGGVGEVVATHYYNLFLNLFDYKDNKTIICKSNFSGVKGAIDTVHLTNNLKSKFQFSILCSYSSAFDISIKIFGTNGIISYDGNKLNIQSPRDTFDSEGRFSKPPTMISYKINHSKEWKNSLSKSVSFFIDTVSKGNLFNKNQQNVAIRTMRPFY